MILTNKIIPLALLTAFVVFCELPVHADGKSVITLSEGVTSAAFASPEVPSLTAPVHDPTNCLPDCVSGDSEDAPAMITAPIQPQKTAVAGQTAGKTSCCGTNTHEMSSDKWFTSNVAHPAKGAVVAWIYRQNDTWARYLEQDFHNPAYRNTLLRAFALATVAAVLWKIGPLSEATIGHVGLYPTVNKWGLPIRDGNRSGLNDYVLNEAGGILLMIGEDWLDKHVARPLEGHIYSRAPIDAIRIFTGPTRSFASLMASQKPWFRENRN